MTNPLYTQLAQPQRGPSLGLTALMGGGVAALALALSLPALLPGVSVFTVFSRVTGTVLPVIAVGLPLVLVALSARSIATLRHSEGFALVRLTGMPPEALARAFVQGALYRQRVLLAVGAGLVMVEVVAVLLSLGAFVPNPPTVIPNTALILALVAVRALAVGVARIGWMAAASIVGVAFGVTARRVEGAVTGGILTVFGFGVLTFFAGRWVVVAPGSPAMAFQLGFRDMLFVAVPLLIMWVAWRFTLRAVRDL